jgi:hypothetical protein
MTNHTTVEETLSAEARAWLVETYGEPERVEIRKEYGLMIHDCWFIDLPKGFSTPIGVSYFKEANFEVETQEVNLQQVKETCELVVETSSDFLATE